jgi:hypothetical protein
VIPHELSADARRLAEALAGFPIGYLVSHAQLTRLLGRDVATCRHVLYRAMRVVQREHGAIFASVHGKGYRRLSTEGLVETVGSHARSRIRGTARRAALTLRDGVRAANDVTPAAQRKASAELAVLGMIQHMARDRTVERLEASARPPESVASTARAMLRKLTAP